jgi:hypothetical protein
VFLSLSWKAVLHVKNCEVVGDLFLNLSWKAVLHVKNCEVVGDLFFCSLSSQLLNLIVIPSFHLAMALKP